MIRALIIGLTVASFIVVGCPVIAHPPLQPNRGPVETVDRRRRR